MQHKGISVKAGPHFFSKTYRYIKQTFGNKALLQAIACSEARHILLSGYYAIPHLLKFYNKGTLALQEQFVVLYLNHANSVLGSYPCSTGDITGTLANIRLILGVALKSDACDTIFSHNHPSGNLKSSSGNQELTKKLKETANLMDIKLLEHLIVYTLEGEYYSFAENGLLLLFSIFF